LALSKSSSPVGILLPGETLAYTVTATNIGAADFTDSLPAVVVDNLTATSDDAELQAAPTASAGTVTYDEDTKVWRWEGPLAVSASVTISYTVKVVAAGDGANRNVAWQPADPTDPDTPPACEQTASPPADPAADPACAVNDHPLPKLTLAKELLSQAPFAQGKAALYQLTITNSGKARFSASKPAVAIDDISDLLDGGVFNQDQKVVPEQGSLTYNESRLTWTGPLEIGQSVVITYSVTWLAIGNGTMRNVVWQPEVPANPGDTPDCDEGTGLTQGPADQPCAQTLDRRPLLEIAKTSDATGKTLTAGDTVHYTVTGTNIGQADYDDSFKAVIIDSLRLLLGAAHYNDDAAAMIGDQPVADPVFDPGLRTLRWEGPLKVDETVEITFSTTLTAGGTGIGRNVAWSPLDPEDDNPPVPNCPEVEPSIDPTGATRDPVSGEPCAENVYQRPALGLSKWSDASSPKPGDTVTFKIVGTNTSMVDFTEAVPAIIVDDLTEVLDDAAFGGLEDVTVTAASAGDLSYNEPLLTWSGPLKSGENVELNIKVRLGLSGDGFVRNVSWRPNNPRGPVAPDCDQASGSTDPETIEPCAVTDFDKSGLKVTKTASPADPMPNTDVTYTLTVKNVGRIAFTDSSPVRLYDDLSELLNGAELTVLPAEVTQPPVGDFNLTKLQPDYAGEGKGTFFWSGPLAPGEVVTVTYTVKLADAMSATRGSNIAWVPGDPANPTPPACLDVAPSDGLDDETGEPCAKVTLTPPILEIDKTSTIVRPGSELPPSYPKAGDQVIYTLTITNVGSGGYTEKHPAVVVDSLSGVLDDATWDDQYAIISDPVYGSLNWNDDADAPMLTWSGELPRSGSVVVRYSVTLTGSAAGNGQLVNLAWAPPDPEKPAPPKTCEEEEGPWCASTELPWPDLKVTKSVAEPTRATRMSGRLTYTVEVSNTGKGDFTKAAPALMKDDLSDLLDDAVWVGVDQAPASGTADYNAPMLTWSGPLPAGETVKLVYSLTIKSGGDGNMRNVAWCPDSPEAPFNPPACDQESGGEDPATGQPCGSVDLLWPILELASKTVDASGPVGPGSELTYTVVAKNTGTGAFTDALPALVSDSLKAVLDDSEPFDLATAADGGAGGEFHYDADAAVLTWTGPLAVGDEVKLTYKLRLRDGGDGLVRNVAWIPDDPAETPPEDCPVPMDPDAGGAGGAGGIDPTCQAVEVAVPSPPPSTTPPPSSSVPTGSTTPPPPSGCGQACANTTTTVPTDQLPFTGTAFPGLVLALAALAILGGAILRAASRRRDQSG
jgi:uncharacterized repeat protein (TIGR01451 family)